MEKSPGMPLRAPPSRPCMGAVRTGGSSPSQTSPLPRTGFGCCMQHWTEQEGAEVRVGRGLLPRSFQVTHFVVFSLFSLTSVRSLDSITKKTLCHLGYQIPSLYTLR